MHPHRNHNNQDTPAWGFAHKVHLWQMLDWRSYLLIGALLFIMFYWVIPEWLHYELDVLQQGTPRPITATLLARRIDWIQYCGMALGAGCILFAMRNYLDLYISEKNRNVEFFNRLFTRGNSE